MARIGKEHKTSVYKFPKKTNTGKTLWYKSLSAFGTGPTEEYLARIEPFPEGSAAQKAFIKDLEKQFKYPLNSQAAKDAGVLSKKELAKKHGITFKQASIQTEKYKNKLKLKYPSPPYEGKAYKKFKQRERRGFITKTSKPVTERDITKIFSKKGQFELGHRASLKQLVKLGVDYPVESLGFDTRTVNQELVKPFEKKLESLYKLQNEIADKYKGKVIPKAEQLKLSRLNTEISDLVEKTNRNLNGVLMNEKTGKFSHIYGQDPLKSPGAGLLEKSVKETTKGDIGTVQLNVKEQAKFAKRQEDEFLKTLKTLYKSEPPGSPVRKVMENTVRCADGCFIKVANANPTRVAKQVSNDPKLIRLFRGESFPQRNVKGMKESAKHFGTTLANIKKDKFAGQWYTPNQIHAGGYLSRPGRMKYVDVTPAELEAIDKFKTRANRTNVKYSEMAKAGKPFTQTVTKSPAHKIIPRYKLKQFEEAGRLKKKYDLNPFTKRYMGDMRVKSTRGVLEWDDILGGFVDSANPSEVVSQRQITPWARENPMPVKVGEAAPGILRKTGKALAHIGLPLPTAALDAYFIGRQVEEGKSPTEIAKDPFNWLGLATMESLSKATGAIEKSGKLSSIMRLGMSPGLIRGASRFLGLPGLALSTGLTAYDQYQKYKNKEGFIYDLFTPEEIDNTERAV